MKSFIFALLMVFTTICFASNQGVQSTNISSPMYTSWTSTLSQFDMYTWRRCWIGPYGHRHCRWGY